MTETSQDSTTSPVPAAVSAPDEDEGMAADAAAANERWEIAAQWRLGWRAIKLTFFAAIVLAAFLVIGQGYLFYNLFSDIHPWLGYGFVAVLTIAIGWLIGVPVASYLRTPAIANPPDVHFHEGVPRRSQLDERLRFDVRYLKGMRRNRELADQREDITAAMLEARALIGRVRAARNEDLADLARETAQFEKTRILGTLSALDARVDKYIRTEAVAVGAATAVSLNGTIDAFIVLWRNVNMVSRVARLYFGRPHLRGSLLILRDVAAAVVLSRAIDDISELSGEAVGGLLGRFGGIVAGPVMDGAVNALMSLKIGYLAKSRCRAFEAWSGEEARAAAANVFERVRKESGSIAGELLKACGGLGAAAARTAENTAQGARNAWSVIQGVFVKKNDPAGDTPQ